MPFQRRKTERDLFKMRRLPTSPHVSFTTAVMRSFSGELEASLGHLELPLVHCKYVGSTNLIERIVEEERRPAKTLPRFWSEHSDVNLSPFRCHCAAGFSS
ncbi:MAG TPA: hypothetical protein VF792_10805 [Ktedonobacterales bacterium]